MNETIKSILGRKSVRCYKKTSVEKEKIELILKCGQYAPSGMNCQPWYFTVITNRKILDKISAENKRILFKSENKKDIEIAKEKDFDNFRGAPMAIIVSGENSAKYALADCANAVENMAIAAYSLGLGSCYLASFKVFLDDPSGHYLLDELKIPKNYTPFYALAIGYEDKKDSRERKPRRKNTITYIK